MATSRAYGSSWARDRIRNPTATHIAAVAMPDPLTYCGEPGIKPSPPQLPKPLQLDS